MQFTEIAKILASDNQEGILRCARSDGDEVSAWFFPLEGRVEFFLDGAWAVSNITRNNQNAEG